MPVTVKKVKYHECPILDAAGRKLFTVQYRTPTPQEHVAYHSEVYADKDKWQANAFNTGLKYGRIVIVGIAGDLELEFMESEDVPDDPIDQVCAAYPSAIATFANWLFVGYQAGGPANAIPFEKNSSV